MPRRVEIFLSKKVVGKYLARSYPHPSMKVHGREDYYEVPVHEITISGEDDSGKEVTYVHQAPRFMPYWNDPANPYKGYKTLGWANSGLSSGRTIVVPRYKKEYQVQNRYSPGIGAIVLRGAFYIHAGPASTATKDAGFGSAGCVEIVGDFDDFKKDIVSLSGIKGKSLDDAIESLVRAKKLIAVIEGTKAPDIKKAFKGSVTKAVPTP